MFFNGFEGLLRVAVTGVCAYAWLVLVLRLSGKRSLAKLNAFDFAVTVAFGSALATVLLSKDVPLAEGALALGLLALLQYAVPKVSLRFPPFRRLISSRPTLMVENGTVLEEALRHELIARSDIEAAARAHGLASFEEAAAIVLETDGSFSVIRSGAGTIDLLRSVRRID
jgi:uncharacterized membrane protein YcaP (DUF421 family)